MNASVLEARNPVSCPGRTCSIEGSLPFISWPLVDLLQGNSQFFSRKCSAWKGPSSLLSSSDSGTSYLPPYHQKSCQSYGPLKTKSKEPLPSSFCRTSVPLITSQINVHFRQAFPFLLQPHPPGSSDEFCHVGLLGPNLQKSH